MRSGQKQGQQVDACSRTRVWGPRQALFKRALPRIDEAPPPAPHWPMPRVSTMIKGIGGGDIWDEFLRLGLAR